jgi:hypothetical protein
MHVPDILEAAGLLVPEKTATENDITVRDVWEYLVADDWETALGLLEEFGNAGPLPLTFWETLGDAAEQLRMGRSAAWCHRRSSEIRNGMIRADLTLRPAGEGRRSTPIDGAGVRRPMWDIGHRTATGERSVNIAALWLEDVPFLEPGGRCRVRLVPFVPASWQHLEPGHRITMHEGRAVAGTAVVLEVRPPVARSAG